MADYTKIMDGENIEVIRRNSDNAFIPLDEDNIDYAEYLEWLTVPNTPDEENV